MEANVRTELERVMRDAHGRILAHLISRFGDVALAEDALGEAVARALEVWPSGGLPQNPAAWLLTAAHRKLIDTLRHGKVQRNAWPELGLGETDAAAESPETAFLGDERLGLLFVCTHPAIDEAARAPLMLQTVLGLNAEQIAAAFVVPAATMGQRLSRAKQRIRDAQVPFQVPPAADLPGRIDAVLDAIYVAYGHSYGEAAVLTALGDDAIELAAFLTRSMPEQAEAHGLLALMLFSESRRAARRDPRGAYVPLSDQDPSRWDRRAIELAESHLRKAASQGRLGRFQLEAAIQSAHAVRIRGERTDWAAICALYEGLVRVAPTVGALVGRLGAVLESEGPDAAWLLLAQLPAERFEGYQPFHALRGHLLALRGDPAEATAALLRAADLTANEAERKFLRDRAEICRNGRG